MKFFSSIIILLLVGLAGCQPEPTAVVDPRDYSSYMNRASQSSLRSLRLINTDISFWSKRLKKTAADDPVSGVKLAGLYASRFKLAGDIHDIHTSDSLYLLANPMARIAGSSVYRSLAANCLTQHKFRQADRYVDSALAMGDEKYASLLIKFDVMLELGDLTKAKYVLEKIADKNDFDYLVREAKLLDHEGDLPAAIKKMEKAVQQVEEASNEKLVAWAKTNLADMYGHNNQFHKAYRSYLDVLKKDPEDFYALKGIAWLAFSHDRNVDEAKRILNYLAGLHPVPDYELVLAEIADYENDAVGKEAHLGKFLTEVSNPLYGDMYNKYVFQLLAEEQGDLKNALALAEKEVRNRPTPQSFDLLAWAKFQQGKKEEALNIARSFVEKRNFEPDALFHLGIIYSSAGNTKKARKFLEEAKQSTFELGPSMEKQLNNALEKL
jgi:tetratricopeptide (TPR) repeat protein